MRYLILAAMVTGCALETPPADTARVDAAAFGAGDPDIGAVNLAQYSFSGPSRLANRPADAARSVAALDYLAGEISTSPRWDFVSPLTKDQLLAARAELRRVVGIAPGASSQDVVDAMLAYAATQQPGTLTGPIYTVASSEIAAHLAALPYVAEANIATQRLATQINSFGGGNGRDN